MCACQQPGSSSGNSRGSPLTHPHRLPGLLSLAASAQVMPVAVGRHRACSELLVRACCCERVVLLLPVLSRAVQTTTLHPQDLVRLSALTWHL
jgi:hypothetical protein